MENKKLNDNELEQVSGGVDDVFDVKDGFASMNFTFTNWGRIRLLFLPPLTTRGWNPPHPRGIEAEGQLRF